MYEARLPLRGTLRNIDPDGVLQPPRSVIGRHQARPIVVRPFSLIFPALKGRDPQDEIGVVTSDLDVLQVLSAGTGDRRLTHRTPC